MPSFRLRPFLLLLLGASSLLTSCETLPGFQDEPALTISPYYVSAEVTGRTRAQSSVSGMIVNNATIDLDEFGVRRDDDVGIWAQWGDGFSGLRVSYYQMDQINSNKGVLTADWLDLDAGDQVRTELYMDEFRINYTAALYNDTFLLREEDLAITAGVGGTIAHREMQITVREETALLRESQAELSDDGVFYATARAMGTWRGASLTVDYAYSNEMNFGGDFDGTLQDLEITLAYDLEFQGTRLFAGWRRSDLPASGNDQAFRVDTDFQLEGFFFGLGIDF